MDTQELRKTVQKLSGSFRSIAKYLGKMEILSKDPIGKAVEMEEAINKIEKALKEVERPIVSEIRKWLEEKRMEVEEAKKEMKFEFGRKLQNLLKEKGKTIEGRYPILRVGILSIEVDFTKNRASILFGPEKMKVNIPLDPEKIVRELENLSKEMMKSIDSQREMDLLYEAYRRVCRMNNIPLGERVPVMEVLQQYILFIQSKAFLSNPLRANFREYGRARFGYDLYRLRKSGVKARGRLKMFLVTATFDATRKKENFIWVPDNEKGEGTTYSYIAFREA